MTVRLNPELIEKMLADDLFHESLAEIEGRYQNGDRSAILEGIQLCAMWQAVMPPWITDELVSLPLAIERFEYAGTGDFFGDEPPCLSRRERRRREREGRIKVHGRRIKSALIRHRWDGGSWNAEEAFDTVADEIGVPRRDVEEVYRRNPSIRSTTRAPEHVEIAADIALPEYVRDGRPILSGYQGYRLAPAPRQDTE